MSLVHGFERYEGLGIFGSTRENCSQEVVVNISPNAIEIKDFDDNPMAMWLPSAITDNGRAHAEKRYFPMGDDSEYLMVRDPELAHYLNAFVTENQQNEPKPLPAPPRYSFAIFGVVILVGALFLLTKMPEAIANLTTNQISREVMQKLDHAFSDALVEPFDYCNIDAANAAKREIARSFEFDTIPFDVVKGLPEPALRLPSGRLLIDQSTLLGLPDDRDLRGLILIETMRETQDTRALRVLIDETGSFKMFNLLRQNGITSAALRPYIDDYRKQVSPKKADYEFLIELDEGLADTAYFQLYDIAPTDGVKTVLSDQAWVALGALCSDE